MARAGGDIAKATGAKFQAAPLKTRARIVEQLDGDHPGNITDAARGGFIVSSIEQGERVIAALAERYAVVDEGWTVAPGGYFDRKVMVRFENGVVGEIQMWPPGMFELKEAKGHKLYEEWRQRETGLERKAALEAQMRDLYGELVGGYAADFRALASSLSPAARSAPGGARGELGA